ncbi:PASTA domain-containing protein [Flavimobilis sp. GY10621]|uniref:PASTA domain-containing protein n=1 Tax=Flavimobilis rhizosphaerae TaxID=2775421 RepID=A0ABR9DU57_9MICO|nr:PASTA domain-containing protein [Flavimobilis rhizosphaerae]MBD9699550.1 PASTA domain-containing protein [Flavimobilis rhizosphaerae]
MRAWRKLAALLAIGLAVSGCAPAAQIAVPDVVGYRADQAEAIIKDAGFEHVRAKNTVSQLLIFDWTNWVVVAQPSVGALQAVDEDVQIHVGPRNSAATLALLSETAPAYAEVSALVAAANVPTPEPTPNPGDFVLPSIVGLPEIYAVNHGVDPFDSYKPYPRTIRYDLATYLRDVRERDPETADAMADTLLGTPLAWCEFWLPRYSQSDLEDRRAHAEAMAKRLADNLNVEYRPHVSTATYDLLKYATDEAGRRFCPQQAANPGKRVPDRPSGAGALPDGLKVAELPIDVYAIESRMDSSGVWGNGAASRPDVELAVVRMLVMPSAAWTTAAGGARAIVDTCGRMADFLPLEYADKYAKVFDRSHVGGTWPDDRMDKAVRDLAPSTVFVATYEDIACRKRGGHDPNE